MPKQLLNIPSFEGGLNNLLDPRDISLSELSFAQNIMCDRNGIIRNVGIGSQRNIAELPGINEIKAGFGLYTFESSFGVGLAGSATAGAYAGACKFEHENGTLTDEGVWNVLIGGNDGMHVNVSNGGWSTLGETLSSTDGIDFTTISTKAVYHIADEGLRISNVDYDEANSKTSKNRWFGFIQNKNYFVGGTIDTDYYFNGWYFLDNDIKAPTAFNVSTGQFAGDTLDDATAGAGFDLYIASDAGGNHDFSLVEADDGTVTYEFASSFIYDGTQESLPFKSGNIAVLQVGTASTNPGDHASFQLAIGVKTGYNPRITGGRIYFRKYQSNDEWVLLVDIDFEKGCRASLDDVYPNTPWIEIGSGNGEEDDYASTPYVPVSANKPDTPVFSTFLNIDSYYTLNEWSPSEPRISIGCNNLNSDGVWDNSGNNYPNATSEGYKCSAIINRRCFIANTALYKNESSAVASGSLYRERDRIYYSAMNKFDCFPRTTHYIDVVRGDAEEYTALIGYADRLLAFKTYTLYIINIAAQDPREWFLESQHKGMGIKKQCQVTRTGDGVVWANPNGAYSYTGGEVRTTTTEDISFGADIATLTKGKISDENWFLNNDSMAVAYIYRKKQLIVVNSLEATQVSGGYIYDFITGTWTSIDTGIIFKDTESTATSLITDYFGNILYGSWSQAPETEQFIDNPSFMQNEGDTHGIDDGAGNVSGYTLTKITTNDPSAYVSNMHANGPGANGLFITQAWHSDDEGTMCYFEYTTLEDLPAETLFQLSFSTIAEESLFMLIEYKVAGTSDSTYGTVGEIYTNYPQYVTFDESFITSVEDNYTIRVSISVIPTYTSMEARFYNFSLMQYSHTLSFYTFDTANFIDGTLGGNRFNLPAQSIIIQTKDIDFGQPGVKKKVYAIYITHRTPTNSSTQVNPVSYATDGGTTFTNLTGNITDTDGAWSVSKFYSATPIECQSIRFKVTNPSAVGMLEINDMAIEYRQIHKNVA